MNQNYTIGVVGARLESWSDSNNENNDGVEHTTTGGSRRHTKPRNSQVYLIPFRCYLEEINLCTNI